MARNTIARPVATRVPAAVVLGVVLALILASCGDSAVEVASGDGLTRPLDLGEPGETPPVDTSNASVALESIVFDTFDGGSVTLAEADDATIARLFDAIAPIDAPEYNTASQADTWLTDDDLVVGFVDQAGLAWAYPVRILNFHEIVNEELSGQPVLISYCPLCGSGVVFDRRLGERTLSFSNTSALHQNDMVMVDRETGSYWWQLAGLAVVGALNEQTLSPLAAETTSWQAWREAHPETSVLERPSGRSYDQDPFAQIGASLDAGRTPFPVDAEVFEDDRLASSARVVVIEVGEETRAYATSPARTIEDTVGGTTVTVQADGVGATVTGPDGPLPVRFSFWYAALAAFPDVTVGP